MLMRVLKPQKPANTFFWQLWRPTVRINIYVDARYGPQSLVQGMILTASGPKRASTFMLMRVFKPQKPANTWFWPLRGPNAHQHLCWCAFLSRKSQLIHDFDRSRAHHAHQHLCWCAFLSRKSQPIHDFDRSRAQRAHQHLCWCAFLSSKSQPIHYFDRSRAQHAHQHLCWCAFLSRKSGQYIILTVLGPTMGINISVDARF